MKRLISPFVIISCFMLFSTVQAEITWDTTEFNYGVVNSSTFYYYQNEYYEYYNEHIIKDQSSSSYASMAETEISEYEGDIQIEAMATGPEGGIDPQEGMIVRASLSTVAQGLNDQQGADIDLEAYSRIYRYFTVDQQERHTVNMQLNGTVDFDSFNNGAQYNAGYSIQSNITLEQVVGTGEDTVVTTMPGFPITLTESDSSKTVAVQLRPVDDELSDITYRIRTEIILQGWIDNLSFPDFSVAGDVNGTYNLGTFESPFTTETLFVDPADFDSDQDGTMDDVDNCPNDSNPDQLDSDSDGSGNACEDCPDDPDKTEPGVCGCGVPEDDTDSDEDGTINCLDAFPDDPNEWEDTDQDGTGNNEDTDDDGDGMPDIWENQYGLDPLTDDSGEDTDGDGWSNYREYRENTDPTDPESHPEIVNITPIIQLLLSEDTGEID